MSSTRNIPYHRKHPIQLRLARSATHYLRILPAELWLACWALCSRRQLRRLGLVCKLFRAVCLPLLFQHQIIDAGGAWQGIQADNWTDRLHKMHRAAVRLDKIAESPHIASIQSWKFIARNLDAHRPSDAQHFRLFETTYERVVGTFSTTLRLYHNLRSLHLEGLTIDSPFRRILRSLSKLEDLTLSSCDIVARDGFILRLANFTVSRGRGYRTEPEATRDSLRIVSPASLHTLHIDDSGEIGPLFAAFGRAPFPRLVVLSLENLLEQHVLNIFSVLEQCPKLESLTITIATPRSDLTPLLPERHLSPNTVPLLRNLTGRRELIGLFTFNRPISAVTILNGPAEDGSEGPSITFEDLILVLENLLNVSVPLLFLSIPDTSPTPDLMAAITSFPLLQELSINCKQPKFLTTSCERPVRNPVDTRCPILRDADAFENIPEEELSDSEQDAHIVRVQGTAEPRIPELTELHQLLHRLCNGSLSLPPDIQVLRFIWSEWLPSFVWPDFSVAEQTEIIAVLSQIYPRLREVRIGHPEAHWKHNGAVWKKTGADSYMQVI
ncbi:hypothetical protein B0H11DRAFT_2215577 [Mycena galericulata]|nr:hypothetical protein B0H11DRAFT_2215577 [Mycena galericulata]